jgi:hypothetical protein
MGSRPWRPLRPAVEEAVRTGLPTAWRAYRVAASAFRAVGDVERALEHAAHAEREFADVVGRIHDAAIRDRLVSAATSGPSWEGERWR